MFRDKLLFSKLCFLVCFLLEVKLRGKKAASIDFDHEKLKGWLGVRLRQVRLLRRFTMHRLGTLVGLSWQQIQKYESGQSSLSVSRLMQICIALNIDISRLLAEACLLNSSSCCSGNVDQNLAAKIQPENRSKAGKLSDQSGPVQISGGS